MNMIELFSSLFMLTILEIVLGIDNLVFLSILTQKLPVFERKRARRWGLMFAWMTRLLFLFSALWVSRLTRPLFYIFSVPVSVRNMFLFIGGLFLMVKATGEIHREIEINPRHEKHISKQRISFGFVVFQVGIMDIIFSFDSVLTAIGLTDRYLLMTFAITVAIMVMLFASEQVTRCIEKFPTIKMLALSFLMLIGMTLVAEGSNFHIPRGYIYFAMAFSFGVEWLNILRRNKNVND